MRPPGARPDVPGVSGSLGLPCTASHPALSVTRAYRLVRGPESGRVCTRHTRPDLALFDQGVLGLSQRLVMSGSPMLGCMATADAPTLCTLVLEKYGNCWLSSGTITASFMASASA